MDEKKSTTLVHPSYFQQSLVCGMKNWVFDGCTWARLSSTGTFPSSFCNVFCDHDDRSFHRPPRGHSSVTDPPSSPRWATLAWTDLLVEQNHWGKNYQPCITVYYWIQGYFRPLFRPFSPAKHNDPFLNSPNSIIYFNKLRC